MNSNHRKLNIRQRRLLKSIPGDKERHIIVVKGTVHQKDITILHARALSNRASKSMNGKLTNLKGKADKSVAISHHWGS